MRLTPRTYRTSLAVAAFALILTAGASANDIKPKPPKGAKKAVAKKAVKQPALYVVGYSHLDTQWCWSYPQVIREFIPNTLHENFALFEKYPDYVFNWTGSNRYRFMKEYYPEDYAKLKTYVAQGKWFPAGSSIEEGDVNSPSEESLIRQVMYGNQFFRREFGKASNEYMLPDCFGFPASLPSILAHCGLKGFSTQKLTWGSAVGIPFNVGKWVGPDGQYVVAALNPGSYVANIREDLSVSKRWDDRLGTDLAKDGVAVDYHYYGVGDRGGAPDADSVQFLEKSLKEDGPVHVVGGRADQMFNDLTDADRAKLPTYQGDLELTEHSAGSLSSEAAMKRWNRKNELLADDTERASVVADWLGAAPYDKSRITDAWLRFLPGQFHDLMAGTALPVAYNYTWNDEILAMNEFAGVLKSSIGGVARAMDTHAKGVPVLVYNPLSIEREDVVEANVNLPAGSSLRVVGPDGKEVPSQIESTDKGQTKILFLAKMPSVGTSVYDVQNGPSDIDGSDLKVTYDTLENDRYRVKLDANGDVSSIFDKKASKELLTAPLRLAYQHENPANYPAWNMDWTDQNKPPAGYVDGKPRIEIVERGPARVALKITRESEGSKFIQVVRLAGGNAGNRVEFFTNIDWKGKECALKAVFPLTVSNPQATYNWELGTVSRGNNDPKKYEVPSHKWFDLTDTSGSYGVSILDDCKYASDKPDDSTVRLTLLYTPGTRGGYQHQGTQDWGKQVMTYAVEGHEGDWRQGASQWEAARLNQPLLAFSVPQHGGSLGKEFSFAKTSTPQVSIEAIKKAEDSNEIVVRTNELSGKAADNVHISFARPIVSAREVDGQERPVGPATIRNGELVFSTTAYRPHAFAVKLAGPKAPLKAPKSQPLSLPYNLDAMSSWGMKTDGNLDGAGRTIPGELMPKTIVSDGVTFNMGPTEDGKLNAVACAGQILSVPPGNHRRLYLIAASSDGDRSADFTVGDQAVNLNIQSWNGYIGQWDTRLWKGQVPELTYGWDNPLDGLVPGFTKRATVAWYADHYRTGNGQNIPYSFCYLFRYTIPIPDGVKSVTLPNEARVKLFAASVSDNPNDDTVSDQPLYDVVDHSEIAGPVVSPAAGEFTDSKEVTIDHPFYWSPDWKVRYTTDGTEPTAESPMYSGPFYVSSTCQVKAAQFDAAGHEGPVSTVAYDIEDRTPPTIKLASALMLSSRVVVQFSEPVDPASAGSTSNYSIEPSISILSATVGEDKKTVTLQLAHPIPASGAKLTVANVKDASPNHNAVVGATAEITLLKPEFELKPIQDLPGTGQGLVNRVQGLPTLGNSPWTINMFVFMDAEPHELTMLAGFGNGRDNNGAERFLIQFNHQIHFWGSNIDIDAGEKYDIGKWQMVTATYDGHTVRIYKNGREIKSADATFGSAAGQVRLSPPSAWGDRGGQFKGKIADLTIWGQALPADYIRSLQNNGPR